MTAAQSSDGGIDQASQASSPPDLASRLTRLDDFERELARKAAPLVVEAQSLTHADFFVIGAVRRTLAQVRGFKQLIEARNFPCAAAVLRLQIDTAMRINALFLVADMNEACRAVLVGARFNTLRDRAGAKLSDGHLRSELAKQYPWISPVYEQASDFIHLSGRHFYSSIASTDEETRVATFVISGEDPHRPETVYYEIAGTFLQASRLVGTMILAYLSLRAGRISAVEAHGSGPVSESPAAT